MRKFIKKESCVFSAVLVSLALLATSCHSGNSNAHGESIDTVNNQPVSTAVILPDAVTDIDGNTYNAVQIGRQVWMASNLRTTRYADGTSIALGDANGSLTTPYRYVPGNDTVNVPRYGYLYNRPAVMHGAEPSMEYPSGVQGICPDGWHVPSIQEWERMIFYVQGQKEYVCGGDIENIAKALSDSTGWETSEASACAVSSDLSKNNATGFSALPAGVAATSQSGGYFGEEAWFWSATGSVEGGGFFYSICGNQAGIMDSRSTNYSFSVRCVRDDAAE